MEGRLEGVCGATGRRRRWWPYGVAGFPDLDGSLAAFRVMAGAGADVLEVGPPYSDPLIDGPVIQRAVTAALDAGTRLDDVLGLVNELTASVDAPVVLLVYYNLVAHRGPRRFAAELAAAEACGAVVPDLPPEEAGVAGGRGRPDHPGVPGRPHLQRHPPGRGRQGGTGVRLRPGLARRDRPAGLAGGRDRARQPGPPTPTSPSAPASASPTPSRPPPWPYFADGAIVGTKVGRLADAGLDGLQALTTELATAVHTARS